jgi:hypothetical protein
MPRSGGGRQLQIMTRKQLDVMQCQMPGCDHKNHSTIHFFHSRCHTDADCEVSYDNQLGFTQDRLR